MARLYPHKAIPNLLQVVALITGGISVVLGLVVMGAWHLHITTRLQVLPDSPLIFYNTALVFLLSGLALLALAKQCQQQQGEAVLRDSEARLTLALESARLGTWEWKVLTGELIWSAQCEALFGLTPGSFGGTYESFVQLVHPDDRESIMRSLQEAMQDSGEWEMDYRAVHPDGSIRWIVSTGNFFYNEAGQAVRMLGIARDITERKQTEQMLQESQAQLNLAMEAAHLGTWTLNFLTGKGSWTSQLDIFFGSSPEDTPLSLETWLNAIYPEDRDIVNQVVKSSLEQEGSQYQVEYRVIRPDGGLSWIQSWGQVYRDETGKPIHMTGIALDISDRKRAEDTLRKLNEILESRVAERTAQLAQANTQLQQELLERQRAEQALQENQSLLSGIIEGTTDLIAAMDLDFRYTAFNSAFNAEFLKIFGREIEIGTSMIEALAHLPQELAKAVDIWERALAGEEFTVIQEFGDSALQRNNYEITYSSIRDEKGQRIGASQIVKDVSDRIRAELELRTISERLQYLLSTSPAVIFSAKPDGDYGATYISENISKVLGYSAQDFLEDSGFWINLVHPEDMDRILTGLPQLFKQEVYAVEYRCLHADGTYRWLREEMKVVKDKNGKSIEIVGYLIDISDRIRAEQALRDSEECFRNAFDYAAIGKGLVATDGRWLKVNPALCEITGYSEQELLATTFQAITYPDDLDADLAYANQLVTGEIHSYQMEKRYIHKQGHIVWILLSGSLVRNHQGQLLYFIAQVQDITDRRRAELEMSRSRDLKEAIFNESADAIFLVDSETLLTLDCNRRAVELFEASSKDELIGISAHILQRQQFTPEELVAIAQEINARGFWSREIEYVSKKGNLFWGNLATKQINVAGKVIHLVRVSDITESKQAEKELELQAVITRNMAEGICLVRVADGVIVYANPKFEKMFGYEPGELNGKPAAVVNYEDERMSAEEVAHTLINEILQHGEATYEVHNIKKDGTPFWCRATTSIFDHPEYGSVLVGVQQDITEQKQAEDKIKSSLKEKEVLLKEIHHRVKNNLQIVDSLLQMQARRTKERQAAEILLDSQNRIASIALVHEKLYRSEDLANIDFAQYIPDLTTHLFDTYNVSSDTITLTIRVDSISLEIDTAIPCGLIINELVSNSLKYAFPANREGEIQIEFYDNSDSSKSCKDAWQTERLGGTLDSPSHTLMLIVRDNGIGISEAFDIENTQSLGLTLVQGLVEQLEGTIDLDRSQGTEFRITFPGGRT